jgi:hypothetical protein
MSGEPNLYRDLAHRHEIDRGGRYLGGMASLALPSPRGAARRGGWTADPACVDSNASRSSECLIAAAAFHRTWDFNGRRKSS